MTIRLSRYIGEISYARPISPLYIDDLVEGHAGTYIIVDVGQCHSRLDERRRDKAMVTFVQGTPVTAMEEEHQGRRPSGGRHRAMQIEGLLRLYAVAQVVDTRAALAGTVAQRSRVTLTACRRCAVRRHKRPGVMGPTPR